MCEDTWALNERVIDEDGFLKQAWGVSELALGRFRGLGAFVGLGATALQDHVPVGLLEPGSEGRAE